MASDPVHHVSVNKEAFKNFLSRYSNDTKSTSGVLSKKQGEEIVHYLDTSILPAANGQRQRQFKHQIRSKQYALLNVPALNLAKVLIAPIHPSDIGVGEKLSFRFIRIVYIILLSKDNLMS